MKKIGLIINPIAGMGGAVGLKGTDGQDILKKAIQLGAIPQSGKKSKITLKTIVENGKKFKLLTCLGAMGEEVASELHIKPDLIAIDSSKETSSQTTIDVAL